MGSDGTITRTTLCKPEKHNDAWDLFSVHYKNLKFENSIPTLSISRRANLLLQEIAANNEMLIFSYDSSPNGEPSNYQFSRATKEVRNADFLINNFTEQFHQKYDTNITSENVRLELNLSLFEMPSWIAKNILLEKFIGRADCQAAAIRVGGSCSGKSTISNDHLLSYKPGTIFMDNGSDLDLSEHIDLAKKHNKFMQISLFYCPPFDAAQRWMESYDDKLKLPGKVPIPSVQIFAKSQIIRPEEFPPAFYKHASKDNPLLEFIAVENPKAPNQRYGDVNTTSLKIYRTLPAVDRFLESLPFASLTQVENEVRAGCRALYSQGNINPETFRLLMNEDPNRMMTRSQEYPKRSGNQPSRAGR